MRIGSFEFGWLNILLITIPVAIALEVMHAPAAWIFAVSAVAIIPLAGHMGKATEHLSAHFGAGVGGLLNATFGNAAEMIIAVLALRRGLVEIVKASITGSIIGNILLVLGLSLLCGGVRHKKQTFNPTAASLSSTLLILSAVGLLVPAIFHAVGGPKLGVATEHKLSIAISIVLILTYILSLAFSLKTHRHLFAGGDHGIENPLSKGKAFLALVVATAFVALMSEFLVGSVEEASHTLGLSEVFVGVILVAIIGNAAEHSTAVLVAIRNQMDLSLNIAIGSGIQIALFVAPVLVFLSYALNPDAPMDLIFTPFEVVAVTLSVFLVAHIANDGESHWMEGVLLLAVYAIMGLAFFYMP